MAAEFGACSKLSASGRGCLLSERAILIANHAGKRALIEARDTGKRG